jgi:hypothetical protein
MTDMESLSRIIGRHQVAKTFTQETPESPMVPFCDECGENWPCETRQIAMVYNNQSFLLDRTGDNIESALRLLVHIDTNMAMRARTILSAALEAISERD